MTQVPPGSLWRVLSVLAPDAVGGARTFMSQSYDGIWLTAAPCPPAHFTPSVGEHHLPPGTVLLVGGTVPRRPPDPVGGFGTQQEYVRVFTPILGYVNKMYFNPTLRRMERVDAPAGGEAEAEREEQWHSD